jgi:predicted transcriptional regulator
MTASTGVYSTKEKSYQTVAEKKILKILISHPGLSKNKIMTLAKMSRKRSAGSLEDLVKNRYVNLQNERYGITDLGVGYFDEMTKRDKRGRQSRSQITGRPRR